MESIKVRRESERFYWYFVVIVIAAWIVFRFWWPSAALFRHTYQLPQATPGVLVSDYWSWAFFREALLPLFLLVPFTGMYMIFAKHQISVTAHWVIALLVAIWLVIVMSYDIVDLQGANVPPSDIRFDPGNLARDKRWCCVYGGQPGTSLLCYINAGTCFPGVGVNELHVDGSFVFRFVCNLFFIAVCIFDILWTLMVYRKRLIQEALSFEQK